MGAHNKKSIGLGRPVLRTKAMRGLPAPLVGGVLLMLLALLASPGRAGMLTVEQQRDAVRVAALGDRISHHESEFDKAWDAYQQADYALARRLWTPLAEDGNVQAQFFLGLIYDAGNGMKRDAPKSIHWYQQAAEAGHETAQHNLAVAYAYGDGVTADIHQAMRWWSLSASQGNTDAQYNLGVIYAIGRDDVTPDIAKALKWWSQAAKSGDAQAQFNLGTLYANADNAVRNYCEAVRWWEKSARSGVQQASTAIKLLMSREDYTSCQ